MPRSLVRLKKLIDSERLAVIENLLDLDGFTGDKIKNDIEFSYIFKYFQELSQVFVPVDEIVVRSRLIHFLEQWWNETKGTYICYTSIPNSLITKLSCEIALYLSEGTIENKASINFLMPTLNCFKNHVSQTDLTHIPLQKIIRFCVTSDNFESLIPIELLTYANLEVPMQQIFINPFTQVNLSDNEIKRLRNHSPIINYLVSSKLDFENEVHGSMTLYNAIKCLIDVLRRCGRTENRFPLDADTEAYLALEDFRIFWSYLSPEQVENAYSCNIFKNILEQKILNPDWNDECIFQFQSELHNILASNSQLFLNIAINDDNKRLLLLDYKNKFLDTRDKLFNSLSKIDAIEIIYDGRDDLPITPALQNEFTTLRDNSTHEKLFVTMLADKNACEVREIFAKYKSKLDFMLYMNPNRLVYILTNIKREHFINFCEVVFDDSSDDPSWDIRRLQSVLTPSLKKLLLSSCSSTIGCVLTLLGSLYPAQQLPYLRSIANILNSLLIEPHDYIRIVQKLHEYNKLAFIKIHKQKILESHAQNQLQFLAFNLSDQHRIDFAADFYSHLGIYHACALVPAALRIDIINEVGDKLNDFTQSIADFCVCIKWLSASQHLNYIASVMQVLPGLTNSKYDFINVLLNLPDNFKIIYLNSFDPKILARYAILSAPFVLSTVYAFLSADKLDAFFNELTFLEKNTKNIRSITKNYDFNSILKIRDNTVYNINESFKIKSTLVAGMITKSHQYSNEIINNIADSVLKSSHLKSRLKIYFNINELSLSNSKIKTIVLHDKTRFEKFINDGSCFSGNLLSPKMKEMKLQFDFSVKLLRTFKDPNPTACIEKAKQLFSNKSIRFRLEKSHSFWGWILEKLGLTTGQRMLKFFDKSAASLDSKIAASHRNPQVNFINNNQLDCSAFNL